MSDNYSVSSTVCEQLGGQPGKMEIRSFPDGESHITVNTNCENHDVIIICSLEQPNEKIMSLLLLEGTLRDLGARTVGLVAPYLSYMRQDKRFHTGEGITSHYFSRLISEHFDWLVTVDPHLHRITELEQIYSIPCRVAHAANSIASWINGNVKNPVLIGPDAESLQWVSEVAKPIDVPFLVLEKVRHGDRLVNVSIPDLEHHQDCTPVLVDDIISTGRTMLAAVEHLVGLETAAPTCIAIHGLFADNAEQTMLASGAEQVVTCNTIPNQTAQIDIGPAIAEATRMLLADCGYVV